MDWRFEAGEHGVLINCRNRKAVWNVGNLTDSGGDLGGDTR